MSSTQGPVSPSAPAYEPEKWNNSVTPAMSARYYETHRTAILNIHLKENASYNRLDDIGRRMAEERMSPERRTWEVEIGIEKFLKNDRYYKDDKKLADYYGLDPAIIPALRRDAMAMQKAYGVQDSSNCYTYAMNNLREPGSPYATRGGDSAGVRGSKDPYAMSSDRSKGTPPDYETYKRNVVLDVLDDGAIDGGPDAPEKPGYYRVAVFARHNPNPKHDNDNIYDRHFVRENRDGGWSHKSGSGPVTDRDRSGQPIQDPRTADIGYELLTFVYVPEGGLNVGSAREPSTKPGSIPSLGDIKQGQASDLQAMAALMGNVAAPQPLVKRDPVPETAP